MSTPTDTFVDSVTDGAQRSQEAFSATLTGAMRTWADAVQTLTSGRASVPDVQVYVDRWFDAAQTVLDTQKAFARSFIGAGARTVDVVAQQAGRTAKTVADQAVQATETVTVEAMAATQDAGDKTEEAAHEAEHSYEENKGEYDQHQG